MAYLKINADEKRTKVDMEGTPLSLMCILGTAMEECLAAVVADIPAQVQRATVQGFFETLQLRLMPKFNGSEETDKAAEGKDAPPKQENPKDPTAEEVLEMMGKLSVAETKRLGELMEEKEEADAGYGVWM